MEVLDWFIQNTRVHIEIRDMQPPERLFRRAIGRNEAALSSHAELVWFTDVDHFFGLGCIDGLWRAWESLEDYRSLIWPRYLMIHRNHEIGDRYAERSGNPLDIDPADFILRRNKMAIGGIQIVPGSLARRLGYLGGHPGWLQPRATFGRCRGDQPFRRICRSEGLAQAVVFPGLYRLRHSANGRDLS